MDLQKMDIPKMDLLKMDIQYLNVLVDISVEIVVVIFAAIHSFLVLSL